MSIRGIFLYLEENLLFHQTYPIIEKEVKAEKGKDYHLLPNANYLQNHIREKGSTKTNINLLQKENIPTIKTLEDSFIHLEKEKNKILDKENLDLNVSSQFDLSDNFYLHIEDKTWQVVTFKENNFSLFIFPKEQSPKGMIVNNSNLYATTEFGRNFMDFIKKSQLSINNIYENLEFILLNCVPFGRILSDNFSTYLSVLSENKRSSALFMPYDKAPLLQDKLLIEEPIKKVHFTLEENILVYQFNKEQVKDFYHVEGKIKGKVDSISDEEISFVLSNLNEEIIKNIALKTNGVVEKSIVPNQISTKITFSIPDEKTFDICHYVINNISEIPIKANYYRKQLFKNQCSIRIELNILSKFKSCIKNLKAQLQLDPFKKVLSTDLQASHGKFEVIQSKSLLWTISNVQDIKDPISLFGNFTIEETNSIESKGEVSLDDYLKSLRESNGLSTSRLEENDILFSMPDKFIQIEFEMSDSNISGLNISQNQVTIYPTRKLDIKIQKVCYPIKYLVFLNDDFNSSNFTNFVY